MRACKSCRVEYPAPGFHAEAGQLAYWCHECADKQLANRGLLCAPCNRLLGAARDEPAVLDAAAQYVRLHKAEL